MSFVHVFSHWNIIILTHKAKLHHALEEAEISAERPKFYGELFTITHFTGVKVVLHLLTSVILSPIRVTLAF